MLLLPRRTRCGFTLIELLVVIAIIAILIGLLLPAVQKVREAAARSKCSNNLKQVVIGTHMYQDTYQKLPAGWVTSQPSGAVAPNPGWSWATIIMPYIEQGPMYNVIDNGAAPNLTTPDGPPSTPLPVAQTSIKTYRCPSDTGQDLNTNFASYATNNYVCNREVLGPGRTDGSNFPNPLSVQTITDGSSNTILFGERDTTTNVAAVYVRHSVTSASFEARPGYGICPRQANNKPYTTGNNERLAYSSNHTGGAQFALADGHVVFLSKSIDADPTDTHVNFPANNTNFTLQKLQHPADNLPVNLP